MKTQIQTRIHCQIGLTKGKRRGFEGKTILARQRQQGVPKKTETRFFFGTPFTHENTFMFNNRFSSKNKASINPNTLFLLLSRYIYIGACWPDASSGVA